MWWLLLALAYMVIGVVWGVVAYILEDGYMDDDEMFIQIAAWPVVLITAVVVGLGELVRWIGSKVAGHG